VRLQAVVFDFYGTLAPGRSVAAQVEARAAQAEALGVDPRRFDAELTATVDERFRGAGGDVSGSLRWLARRLGADPDPAAVAAAAGVRLTVERGFGEPRREAVDVVRALKQRGLRVGVVSDCSAELPAYFAALPIAPYVDAAVFSFVTGHRKPEPHNYLACCARLGVEPGACLYVGDGGSNELAGARAVGMRAVHLAVPEEVNSLVYGRHREWDGETVDSLAGVLALLGA
jgi:putative hydrolase of the HAD superfamily